MKGTFEQPIPVDWAYLTDETLCPGGIKVYRNGFSVKVRVSREVKHAYQDGHIGNVYPDDDLYMTIRYFGGAKNGRMWINSFSYSVQHLPKRAQDDLNESPYKVAKHGLEVVGVAF